MPSDYDFPKIKSFRKKVGLPSMSKWHVSSEDTLVSGRMLTMVKQKGYLCDGTTSAKQRETTVTKQGYMIIYFSDEKGYVVDIPESTKVTTCTTTLKARDLGGVTTTLRRTQIEVKFRFGSVTLSAMGKDALPWIEAINRLVCPSDKETPNKGNRLSCQFDTLPVGKRESRVDLDHSVISDNSITIASPLPSVKKLPIKENEPAKDVKANILSLKPLNLRKSPLLSKKLGPVLKAKAKLGAKKAARELQAPAQSPAIENKRRNTVDSIDSRDGAILEKNKNLERKNSGPAATSMEKINRC